MSGSSEVFRLKSGDSVNLFKKREGEAKMDLPEITAEAGLVCETLALFRREGRALCPAVSILGQEGTVCVKFQVEVRRRLRFSFSDKRKVEESLHRAVQVYRSVQPLIPAQRIGFFADHLYIKSIFLYITNRARDSRRMLGSPEKVGN